MTIYLIDGKPHRACECDRLSSKCALGRQRTLATAEFNRCLLPAPDVVMTAAAPSEIGSPYTHNDHPSRHFDRTCPECGCGNRLNGNLIHASNCSLKSLSEQETPLRAVVVDGAIQFIVGANVLKHATDICPALWDHENDRGQFRVTNPAVFAEAVTRELNREREDGSTILTDVMDKAVYEAINQGSEGVEEVK